MLVGWGVVVVGGRVVVRGVALTVGVEEPAAVLVGVEVGRHRARVLRHVRAGPVRREERLHPRRERVDRLAVEAREREHGGAVARGRRVEDHARDVHPHVRGEVGLVDDEQVRPGDPRPALARDVAAPGDVEHEDLRVDERGREGGGEVVAAGLDEHDVERREVLLEVLDGEEVGGDVVADRGVRARAGLDRADALGVEHARGAQEPRVLVRVDVVGDDPEAQHLGQLAAQERDERALAGADGAGDAEAQRAGRGGRGGRSVGQVLRH
ncbi:Uncharacterised protein [Mycobacteroides abscessus]|nr:Uncharacterised protein [Mycobacteroides abscessus]